MAYPNAYCVKCQSHTNTEEGHTVLLQNASRALTGLCPDCGSQVYRIMPPKPPVEETEEQKQQLARDYPDAYCLRCQANTPICNAHRVVLENDSWAVAGNCKLCDAEVYRFIGAKSREKQAEDAKLAVTKQAVVIQESNRFSLVIAMMMIMAMIAAFLFWACLG